MCIAIVKPKGCKLPKDHAEASFASNSHGAGFAYIDRGVVRIKKGYFTFAEFWEAFEPIQEKNDKAMLIHFRIATSGGTDKFNCHPWRINAQHALIHNGVISAYSYSNSDTSDTGWFTELVMKKIFNYGPTEHRKPHIKWLLNNAVGTWNKIAVLGADGEFTIFNENGWTKEDGIYYSNGSFRPRSFFRNGEKTTSGFSESYSPFSKKNLNIPKIKVRRPDTGEQVKASEIGRMKKEMGLTFAELCENGFLEKYPNPEWLESLEEGAPEAHSSDYIKWWMEGGGAPNQMVDAGDNKQLQLPFRSSSPHMAFDENEYYSG